MADRHGHSGSSIACKNAPWTSVKDPCACPGSRGP
jgi:hypothetical protein